jgi:hypothetical protein
MEDFDWSYVSVNFKNDSLLAKLKIWLWLSGLQQEPWQTM